MVPLKLWHSRCEGKARKAIEWCEQLKQPRAAEGPRLGVGAVTVPPPPGLNGGLPPLLPLFQHLHSFNICPYVGDC